MKTEREIVSLSWYYPIMHKELDKKVILDPPENYYMLQERTKERVFY